MSFEDYCPRDRRLGFRAHLASWLILLALAGAISVAIPAGHSDDMKEGVIAFVDDECFDSQPG